MRSNEISALKTVKCSTPRRRVETGFCPSERSEPGAGLRGGAEAGVLLLLQRVTHT